MVKFLSILLVICVLAFSVKTEKSATSVAYDIYTGCLQHYSVNCVKPKALSWMSNVVDSDVIKITEDLMIVKTGEISEDYERSMYDARFALIEKIEDFLETHTLKISVPEDLKSQANEGFFSRNLIGDAEDLVVPLSVKSSASEGRSSFVKKIIVPFVLGLKFKASVIVPLALALIALKTWKALTLGLLSLVLSGAMAIFKLTKPKVVNYEVVHYPQHVEHHADHSSHGWDNQGHSGYSRSLDAQQLAYNAYQ